MSPNPDVGKSIEDKFKNKNLRTIWRKMKKTMLRNIDKFDKETESREGRDLRRKLDRGLGPLLDSWDRELKKFPKHDPQKVGSIGRRVERTIITYKKNIRDIVSDVHIRIALEGTLQQIAKEMTRQLRWYTNPEIF